MIKILLILFLATYSYAFTIESSYAVAHEKALKEDKILLVFLTQKGCRSCNKELSKIIENYKIRDIIDTKAVFVIVMKNQKESYPIEMLYTTYYPTLFFLGVNELPICNALQKDINFAKILDCFESN